MKTRILLFLSIAFSGIMQSNAQNLPNYVDTTGLVAFYPFNGNANDASGKGNNGTINGGSFTGAPDRFGVASQSMVFDGVDDYISIPRTAILEPANAMTINAWIIPLRMANIGWRVLVSKPHTPGVDPYISYTIQTSANSPINNKWQFALSRGTTGSLTNLLAKQAYPDGDTLMLTAVLGNGQMKLYIDGKLDTTTNFTGSIGYTTQNLLIGYSLAGPNEYYKGKIDEFGLWNRALTPAEIEKMYTGGCKPNFPIELSAPEYALNAKAQVVGAFFSNANYHWQANPLNMGWRNIPSMSGYTGVTTRELGIDPVKVNHHLLPLRLIATYPGCSDTSMVKELVVKYCIPDTFFVKSGVNNDTLFISVLTSVNPTEQLHNRVLVYPNPAATLLNFSLEKPGTYKAELVGVNGSISITTTVNSIDISSLANGVYVLKIYDSSNRLISTNKVSIIR